MAVDVAKYLSDLLNEAGVAADDPARQALTTLAANEKFSKPLSDGVMRHDEYARSLDGIRTDKAALDAERQRVADYWQKETQRTQRNQQIVDDINRRVQAYETKYGSLDGNDERQLITTPTDGMVTKKDFEAELQKRDNTYISLLQQGLKLVGLHYHEFQEPLDTDALAKTAMEKNLSLQQAYDDLVKPKREVLATTQRANEIKQAKEEGAREFASTHKIPVDTKPREAHLIFDRKTEGIPTDKPGQERFARDSFVQGWTEASTSGGS